MSEVDDYDDRSVLLSEEYDPGVEESVSARIVRLVAVAEDRPATDLDPLGDYFDVDALDELVDSKTFGDPERRIEVTFTYHGYHVEIEANGTVNVCIEN